MSDKLKQVVIALGYFDSVHIGHQKVIDKAQKLSKDLGAEMVIFTFSGNLRKAVGKSQDKCVYTLDERKNILQSYGVENVYYAPCSEEFLKKTKTEFLQIINSKYSIKGYVCGKDYKFGRFGEGDAKFLTEFAKANNQKIIVVDDIVYEDKRISSSEIKRYLKEGDIKKANYLLDRSFSISGKVQKERGVGRVLGFPTANLKVDEEKIIPKNGVYYGHCFIENKEYKVIINCGIRPTFELYEDALEIHIINFNGDLYNNNLNVYFDGFIREIKKFSDSKRLIEQLEKDKKVALMGGAND